MSIQQRGRRGRVTQRGVGMASAKGTREEPGQNFTALDEPL